MSTRIDPLQQGPQAPDRVWYATGVLLDAEAFGAEQMYHRGRLARALTSMFGSGTAAGMRVEWQKAVAAGGGQAAQDERVVVHPGIAIDRLGRLIEIPRDACIRLQRWYDAQSDGDLTQGMHGPPYNGVVVDVFVRFVVCERGKTPSFMTGPFDALNGVAPSRLRDSYELSLVIRKEGTPPLPRNSWPDLSAGGDVPTRLAALHKAILDGWHDGSDAHALPPLQEHAQGQDTTALFLARLVLPAAAGTRPVRTAGATVTVDNESRAFAYPAGALARWAGVPS